MKPIDCFDKDIIINCEKEWEQYKNKDCVFAYVKEGNQSWFCLVKDVIGYGYFHVLGKSINWLIMEDEHMTWIYRTFINRFIITDKKCWQEFKEDVVVESI